MMTKNHKCDIYDSTSQGGRINRTGKIMCPYSLFKKYLSVLNNDCDLFFQRPKSKLPENPSTWLDFIAVGKNTIGDKMKTLSLKKKLSKVYTNHCLRATSITLLDSFEARHVMAVPGHKSESSIRSYARTSGDQKQKMALTSAKALSVSGQPVKSEDVHEGNTKVENIENQETNTLHEGILHELGQSRFDSVGSNSVSDLEYRDNVDFLQLSSSQEITLMEAIRTVERVEPLPVYPVENHSPHLPLQPLPISQPQQISHGTYSHQLVQKQSSYRAPIYYFNNCTVNFSHH